jgi:alkanesulfonate monooxygenase SsuD/methylene tetrahydromethanopterin reductase-like flavin-dependent oxidoreductase (luciferase family)
MDWPSTGEQVARMDEALEIIGRLLDGERIDHDGRFDDGAAPERALDVYGEQVLPALRGAGA